MTTQRLMAELAFHDDQARARWRSVTDHAAWLRVQPEAYLSHETWIQPAFDRLGPVVGKAVLDYGCGHGMAGVILAERGAYVTAFDLSGGYAHESLARAKANGVAQRFGVVQAAGERLPFADRSFDRVWGHAILHHLDLAVAAAEMRRVLKPGGWAIFCEPWGGNPLIEWARRCWPYPGKHRSRDEQPLQHGDLAILQAVFPRLTVHPCQILGSLRRWQRSFPGLPWFDRLDQVLLRHCSGLRRLCRYVVLQLPRD